MCRQLLEEGGGGCDRNIAGAANEHVKPVMEDQFISGRLMHLKERISSSRHPLLLAKKEILLVVTTTDEG